MKIWAKQTCFLVFVAIVAVWGTCCWRDRKCLQKRYTKYNFVLLCDLSHLILKSTDKVRNFCITGNQVECQNAWYRCTGKHEQNGIKCTVLRTALTTDGIKFHSCAYVWALNFSTVESLEYIRVCSQWAITLTIATSLINGYHWFNDAKHQRKKSQTQTQLFTKWTLSRGISTRMASVSTWTLLINYTLQH